MPIRTGHGGAPGSPSHSSHLCEASGEGRSASERQTEDADYVRVRPPRSTDRGSGESHSSGSLSPVISETFGRVIAPHTVYTVRTDPTDLQIVDRRIPVRS